MYLKNAPKHKTPNFRLVTKTYHSWEPRRNGWITTSFSTWEPMPLSKTRKDIA